MSGKEIMKKLETSEDDADVSYEEGVKILDSLQREPKVNPILKKVLDMNSHG